MTTPHTSIASYSPSKVMLKFVVVVGFFALFWAILPSMRSYDGGRYPVELVRFLYPWLVVVMGAYCTSVTATLALSLFRRPAVYVSEGEIIFFKWYFRKIELSVIDRAFLGPNISAIGHQIRLKLKSGRIITFGNSAIREHASEIVGQINIAVNAYNSHGITSDRN